MSIERIPHFEGFKLEKQLILTDRELKGIRIKRSEKRTQALKFNNINYLGITDIYTISKNIENIQKDHQGFLFGCDNLLTSSSLWPNHKGSEN